MVKCKNTECNNNTEGKRIYCSLSCRSYYVNKYIRSYAGLHDYIKQKKAVSKKEYELNPSFCKQCNHTISFDKRRNIFCSQSCAATHTNLNRIVENRKPLSSKALKNIRYSNRKRRPEWLEYYEHHPNRCKQCNTTLNYKKRNNKFCTRLCGNKYARKTISEYRKYQLDTKFNFNLSDYSDEFNFKLIEQYGWYTAKNRGDNHTGVSRDHMFSVNAGFAAGIPPGIISHPANCNLMIHANNVKKYTNCSITIDELKYKIEQWNIKYKI